MTHNSTAIPTPVASATVIQVQAPTSAKPGDKALISIDGGIVGWVGGGCVQPAVISVIKTVVDSGQPCLLRVAPDGQWEPVDGLTDYASSCLGRGSLLIFVEPLHTQPTLCVMGASAVAVSLAEQAVQMNLNVVLQAPALLTEPHSPNIVLQSEYTKVRSDYIVIATQGQNDGKAINAALSGECAHIRMVVSERKLNALKDRLRADGFEESALMRLEGPAGIAINAHLPNEIALSVLAEIVQLRRTVFDLSTVTTVEGAAGSTAQESTASGLTSASKVGGSCCGG